MYREGDDFLKKVCLRSRTSDIYVRLFPTLRMQVPNCSFLKLESTGKLICRSSIVFWVSQLLLKNLLWDNISGVQGKLYVFKYLHFLQATYLYEKNLNKKWFTVAKLYRTVDSVNVNGSSQEPFEDICKRLYHWNYNDILVVIFKWHQKFTR